MTYKDLVEKMPVDSILICYLINDGFAPNSKNACILTAKCTGSKSSKNIAFESVSAYSNVDVVYRARYAAPAGTKWTGWEQVTNGVLYSDSEPSILTKNMTWIGK